MRTPPEPYAGYYRPNFDPNLDADRIEKLAKGYFALNWVFLMNVLLAIPANLFFRMAEERPSMGAIGLIFIPVLFFAVAGASFIPNRNIAEGKGWGVGAAVAASFLMGLNSAFCCGIIGYVVMQGIAGSALRSLGVNAGFLGLKSKHVKARLAELRATPVAPHRHRRSENHRKREARQPSPGDQPLDQEGTAEGNYHQCAQECPELGQTLRDLDLFDEPLGTLRLRRPKRSLEPARKHRHVGPRTRNDYQHHDPHPERTAHRTRSLHPSPRCTAWPGRNSHQLIRGTSGRRG